MKRVYRHTIGEGSLPEWLELGPGVARARLEKLDVKAGDDVRLQVEGDTYTVTIEGNEMNLDLTIRAIEGYVIEKKAAGVPPTTMMDIPLKLEQWEAIAKAFRARYNQERGTLIYRLHNWCNEARGADLVEEGQALMSEAAEALASRPEELTNKHLRDAAAYILNPISAEADIRDQAEMLARHFMNKGGES
jgi:hypothetical protein